MSPSDYHTYRKDVLTYQILTQYSDRQIVLQMRLHMDIDLKRSIDTNFGNQWDAFNVDDALDAIKTVVLLTSNVAVYRKEFDKCKNCGYNHIESAVCPASSKACLNCGQTGHFAGVCTGTSSCANCGKQGHRTNACRNAKMMSGVIIAALHRTHALKTALPTISIEIRNCRLLAVPEYL